MRFDIDSKKIVNLFQVSLYHLPVDYMAPRVVTRLAYRAIEMLHKIKTLTSVSLLISSLVSLLKILLIMFQKRFFMMLYQTCFVKKSICGAMKNHQ